MHRLAPALALAPLLLALTTAPALAKGKKKPPRPDVRQQISTLLDQQRDGLQTCVVEKVLRAVPFPRSTSPLITVERRWAFSLPD